MDRNDTSRNSSPPTQAPQKRRGTPTHRAMRREAERTKESHPQPSLAILDTVPCLSLAVPAP